MFLFTNILECDIVSPMDLQELVTGTLPEEQELSPLEILDSPRGSNSIAPLEAARMAEEIAEGDFGQIPLFAAWMSRPTSALAPSSWPRNPSQLLRLLWNAELAAEGNEEAVSATTEAFARFAKDIRTAEKGRRLRATVGNWQKSLDYLQECFGSKTRETVAHLCRVQPGSVASWEKRKTKPRNSSKIRIRSFAESVYRLREEGLRVEDILEWAQAPLVSGRSPLELWRVGRLPEEVSRSLAALQQSAR